MMMAMKMKNKRKSGVLGDIVVGMLLLSCISFTSAASYRYHRPCYRYGPIRMYPGGIPPPVEKSCAEVKAEIEAMGEWPWMRWKNREAPRCLENGHYDLYQCSGSKCFCTDCAGKPIKGVEKFDRGQADESKCVCSREKHEFRGRLGVHHRCDPNGGHYMPYQCRGAYCHCTDQYGKYIQTDDERAHYFRWPQREQVAEKDEFCRGLRP